MKRLYTWGVILWAIGWLFVWPNPDPSARTFLWLAGLGTFLILAASWNRDAAARSWHPRVLIAAAGLAVFAWLWFDLPYLGPLLLAVGAATLVILGRTPLGARLGEGLIVAGSVALMQLAGLYLYMVYVGPRGHGCAVTSDILASAFRLFGADASALPDGLHLFAVDRLYQVVPSLNNMGVYVFLMMFMGLAGLCVTGKIRLRSLITGAFALAVFMLARYAAIVLWDYNQGGMADTFWSPKIFAWTVWPVGFFLHGATIWKRPAVTLPESRQASAGKRLAFTVALVAVGTLAWTAYEGYHPAGVQKQGRMLIDEYHSDWEWTEMPFDTVWYGQQSTYNFYCLAEFWNQHYHVRRHFDSLTAAVLDSVDILVLKVPTQPYSPGEIAAIEEWVADGGGLFLIGEHTNVFGYATFLNPVATRFGQRFISDIIYELKTGDLNVHERQGILPHPVAQNMPTFLFGGPCTMYGDLSARSIMTTIGVKTLPADYTQRNFFPERAQSTGYRFGVFFNALQTRFGKGRIVSFTDSTLWSNFFVFIPGKPELALGLAEYCNRYDPFPYWRILTFLLASVCLIGGAVAAHSLRLEGWLWYAAVGCLVFAGSARWIERANRASYPLPEPHTPFAQLNFESEHSKFFVPELRLAREADKDFSTFFLWTQRVGVVPRKWPTFEESFSKPGGQIIIDPQGTFETAELEMARRFVEGGGTLYVLDDPTNATHSSANQLLAGFGLSLDLRAQAPPAGMTDYLQQVLWTAGGRVVGGEPILAGPDGSAICARVKVGEGQVIAFANSHVFERKTMGYTAMIPNPTQNTISQWEYRLMTYLNYPPVHAESVRETQPNVE
ncbi:MAG TPA: DUF4350 domain-containing protein [bacterium]|nr:DUF4350 domain-containing protein [bacterium]